MLSSLETPAETYATAATDIPGFSTVSLAKAKETVAELASTIGRTKRIFATYTLHDITHINTLLRSLDWLIPEETKQVMTPIDWLLIVLSI